MTAPRFRDKKVDSIIKNTLAFLHLYIVNRICSLNSDVNLLFSFVKKIKKFGSMQIILKMSGPPLYPVNQ